MDIQTLRSLYTKGAITPEQVVNRVYELLELSTADPAVWLHVIPQAQAVQRARELLNAYPDPMTRHPLFGIPFSVKDSIDIKGIPTTAACPEYTYLAVKDAPSFAALIKAGCIVIGKVNLVNRYLSSCATSPYPSCFPRTNWRLVSSGCDPRMVNQLRSFLRNTSLVAPPQDRLYQSPPIRFPSRWPPIPLAQLGYLPHSIT